MSDYFELNTDALLRKVEGAWIFSNPRTRTHVELEVESVGKFAMISTSEKFSENDWINELKNLKGRDRTVRGMGQIGLHEDHSGIAKIDKQEWVSGNKFFDLLKLRSILKSSSATGLERVKPLSGLFDNENLGTFHQRVGQYLMLEKRVKAHWREWHDQKFSHDGKSLLESPYKVMQEPFFDNYFSKSKIANFTILDFGCGNGYYTRKFAERAQKVIGLDNSAELLDIAKANHGDQKNLQLIQTNSFEEVIELLDSWEESSVDLIYLQDTLLLLLQPEGEKQSPMLTKVFKAFQRVLKKNGSMCAMEPNPSFWLANRYGQKDRPYAIVTEYRNPVFNVAPTLDVLLPFMSEAHLALSNIMHPAPDENISGHFYQKEFPIWDFFIFVPLK